MASQQYHPPTQYAHPSAGPSTTPFPSHQPSGPSAGPSSLTFRPPTAPGAFDETITAATRSVALLGRGTRGTRARGVGRGRGRGRGSARGSRGGGRGSSSRTSTRLTARAEQASKVQKLKLNFKTGSGGDNAAGRKTSFLGEYDRELDENLEEPLCFEEQFVLRVPREVAEGANGLREMVRGKGKGLEGVEFKFLDSRRAAFRMNGVTYASKLVDLPCIIESQKTHDSRHLFKVADISQMLVVDQPVRDETSITAAPLKVDDYIWPHGLTPPLRHVRKRRFRKRLSRRTIEVVEEQVEELLKKDAEADEMPSFDLIDAHPVPDIPDSYYAEYDPDASWEGQGEGGSEFGGSEAYGDVGSAAQLNADEWGEEGTDAGIGDGEGEEGDVFGDEEEDGDGDGGFDQELAAALQEQMEAGSEASGHSGSEDALSGSDDDDDASEKSEDDDATLEKKAKIRQFTSEIKALESAVEKKRAGFTGGNPIMMKRFEETIAGLRGDISTKVAARQALIDEMETTEEQEEAVSLPVGEAKSATSKGGAPSIPENEDLGMDDVDAEGEEQEVPTPAAQTSRTAGSPAQATVEEEEDLFGDEQSDVTGAGQDEQEAGAEDEDEGRQDEEVGDGQDDDMAAMLQAELGGSPATPDEQAQASAAAALNDFALLGGLEQGGPDSADQGEAMREYRSGMAGVEGGVGMRRLASGLEVGDDDDESSDDSDD